MRVILLNMLGICLAGPSETAAQTVQPQIAPAVTAWLECVECTDVELKPVISLGNAAVGDLRQVLLNGPAPARLEGQRKHLTSTYRSMKEYEQRRPDRQVKQTEQEYVQLYLQNYVLLNRRRAARALGAIGTSQARDALVEALKTELPPELRRDVERTLKGIR